MGAGERVLVGAREATMKYHSCDGLFLTVIHNLETEQSQVGSLTGAVASQRVTEAPKGSLRVDGHHPDRV